MLQEQATAATVIQNVWRSYKLRKANAQLSLGISSWQELMKRSASTLREMQRQERQEAGVGI